MKLKDGALLNVTIGNTVLHLPMRIDETLADGLIGLPAGLNGIPPVLSGLFADALQEAVQ